MEQPLLSGEESWRSYQHLERTASVHVTPSLFGGEEVTVEEVRAATLFSDSHYPPPLHGALISYPDPNHPQDVADQPFVPQGEYGGHHSGYSSKEFGRQILDEVEIRQLLIEHIRHQCCWGSQPARRWKITSVEVCNVYVGTLETFIEEREVINETEPYMGREVDRNEKGKVLGVWEIDLTSEFPPLFIPQKVARVKVPFSEATGKCSGCQGRGELACQNCNAGTESEFYKENQMSQCQTCFLRGLIAHKDGSDIICTNCEGKGMLPCVTCGSRGLVICHTCKGQGSILTRNIAVVKWRTLTNRKVCATSGAASVPDKVFHRARGVQLCATQAYQCMPAYFADSYILNKFSSEVIAERSPVPPAARIIRERHIISVVPVTRVTMSDRNRSFTFYIIGFSREVYIRDYPSRFCWGICQCFEWLSA